MKFQQLTDSLKILLIARGWTINGDKELTTRFMHVGLFNEPIEILYPQDQSSPDFPFMLSLSLKILAELEPTITKHHCVIELRVLARNIRHKFSKEKEKWILREPKAKYENNEIPDIYIPLK